jgi:hypothetical protein
MYLSEESAWKALRWESISLMATTPMSPGKSLHQAGFRRHPVNLNYSPRQKVRGGRRQKFAWLRIL